jgi:hypothetical protein
MTKPGIRLYAAGAAVLLLTLVSSPASAQFQPRVVDRGAAIGENYHVELGAGLWNSSADMSLANTALDQVGTTINLKSDLGLQDQRFPGFDLILRPAVKHKFRVQLVPVHYSQTGTPRSSLTFGGQTFPVGVPVSSKIYLKAWRFGYEYDFAVASRGFVGMIVDVKYTAVDASLTGVAGATRSASASAPLPALGAIIRIYPLSRVAVTAELTGFKVPGSWLKSGSGHYLDFDTYATLNFVNSFGMQAGYRSFDLEYTMTNDTGTFKLEGPYFGAVIRF